MAKRPSRAKRFINLFKTRAGAAGRWIARARDALGDAIAAASGGVEGEDTRSRFIRHYNRSNRTSPADRTKGRDIIRKAMRRSTLSNTDIGKMFVYTYKAEHDEKLPYWDRYPLIILISPFVKMKNGKVSHDHFLGMNLHYIHPKDRALLMDALNDNLFQNGFDPNSPNHNPRRMALINYRLLLRASRNRVFRPCVKMYIKKPGVINSNWTTGTPRRVTGGVKSEFVEIPGQHWEDIIFLEMAKWKKNSGTGSASGIYSDSRSSR